MNNDLREMYRQADCARLAAESARVQQQMMRDDTARRAAQNAQMQRDSAARSQKNLADFAAVMNPPRFGQTYYAPSGSSSWLSFRGLGSALLWCLIALLVLAVLSGAATFTRGNPEPAAARASELTRYTVSPAARDGLNLRAMPNARSRVLAHLPIGSTVQMLNEARMNGSTRWVCVRYGTDSGWVAAAFLQAE